jgi:hypothetical protein
MDARGPRAWAGAPSGGIPTDWIVIRIGRRACSQRLGPFQAEPGPAERDPFTTPSGDWPLGCVLGDKPQ